MKQCKHKNEYYTCKRSRMLSWLIKEGFEPYETLPDFTNPKFCVWRFKNTPELEEKVEEWFSQYNK